MGIRLAVLLSVVAVMLSGCGGGGGDNDNGIDPGTSMIGTWQPVSATRDGTAVKVSEVMPDTDTEATRWVLTFEQNGNCVFTAYGPAGNTVDMLSGTWSSNNQVAPVTIEGDTTVITWGESGDVITAEYEIDGHDIVAKWVRLVPAPTAHLADMVGPWQAQEVLVNGTNVPLADFFDWQPGSDMQTLIMQSDGNAIMWEHSGSTVVDTTNLTWATNNLVIRLLDGDKQLWGFYEYPMLNITVLDPESGDTIKLSWIVWGDD